MQREKRNESHRNASRMEIALLGIYLIASAMLLAYALVALWPTAADQLGPTEAALAGKKVWDKSVSLFGWSFFLADEKRLLSIVIVTGALGSFVHTATSFGTYVGNRRIYSSWMWWYLLRPFLGMALALVFYFVVYGGLLSAGASADTVNPAGIAAIAGLVGMFTKQGTDKLNETFSMLFKTEKGDAERHDKLDNPQPTLVEVSPLSVEVGASAQAITVKGTHFVAASRVRVGDQDRSTRYVSESALEATLDAGDLACTGELVLTVVNPAPGGGASGALRLAVAPKPTGDIPISPTESGKELSA